MSNLTQYQKIVAFAALAAAIAFTATEDPTGKRVVYAASVLFYIFMLVAVAMYV